MERKYIRYVAPLALATTFALSPMANAKEINVCGDSISVDEAVNAGTCYAAITTDTIPVSVAVQSCRTTAKTINRIRKKCGWNGLPPIGIPNFPRIELPPIPKPRIELPPIPKPRIKLPPIPKPRIKLPW